MSQLNDPGALRRFWWRSTPGRRLTVACLGMALSLTATGLTVANPALLTGETAAQSTPSATPRPGDPAVRVHSVSTVDMFDVQDSTNGDLVKVRVPGIRPPEACWTDDAVAFARKTLEGKMVWLLGDTGGPRDPDGRLRVEVLLPDGQYYAEVVVAAGAGLTGDGSDEQLRSAEAEARQNHRGVWASSCVPSTSGTSGNSPPSSSSSPTGSTTPTGTATGQSTTPVVVPSQPTGTTSPQPQPTDDVQRGVEIGALCSPEGASGITSTGQLVQCKGKGEGLRWRRE